uniref:Uncharacterized protein n=1 Tax=Oryza brachyantha TaxID=4533 RepID=J3MCT1_ORYBR
MLKINSTVIKNGASNYVYYGGFILLCSQSITPLVYLLEFREVKTGKKSLYFLLQMLPLRQAYDIKT